jgi:hypothetical protein
MSSQKEFARARPLPQSEAPISSLGRPQAAVASEVEHPSAPNEIVSSALQELASDLLQHVARKQLRSSASGRSKRSDR